MMNRVAWAIDKYWDGGKTFRIPVAVVDLAGKNLPFPSAGPNPSIKGMRDMYYGKNALLMRNGVYVYKIANDYRTFNVDSFRKEYGYNDVR